MSEEIYQLSAKDAFEIAQDFHKKKQDTILRWILDNVKSNAELGSYCLRISIKEITDSYDEEEVESVANELDNLGYEVAYNSYGEFEINWEDANET